ELEKVVAFYYKQERELYVEVDGLASDIDYVENYEETFVSARRLSSASGINKPLSRRRSRRGSRASRTSLPERDRQVSFPENQALSSEPDEVSQADPAAPAEDSDDGSYDGGSIWINPESQQHQRETFRHRCVDIFVRLSDLKSYVALNFTAF